MTGYKWLMGVLLLGSSIVMGSGFGADAREPLKLGLEIDVEFVDNIDDFPGGEDAFVELIRTQIDTHFRKNFGRFWTIVSTDDKNELGIEVTLEGREWIPQYTFKLPPDGERRIRVVSRKGVDSPGKSNFEVRFSKALRKALKGSYDGIFAVSKEIHENWNFGPTTLISINRSLTAEDVNKFRDDQLSISWKHMHRSTVLDTRPPNPFSHELALGHAETRIAEIRPSHHTSWRGSIDQYKATLCIRRDHGGSPPGGGQAKVTYDCPLSGECRLQEGSLFPSGWASQACNSGSSLTPRWQQLLGISSAHADERAGDVWHVPSLQTLHQRLKKDTGTFVGFTDFEIESGDLKNIDADAYSVTISANGVPVWLDGIAPEENRHHLNVEEGILLRFGLENLQFAGRRNGCETLQAEFRFFKDDTPLDQTIKISRRYAALRHAQEARIDTESGTFSWSGIYHSPAKRRETGLFLKSSRVFPKENKDAAASARAFLNEKRETLDGFNWTIRRSELGGSIGNAGGDGDDVLKLVGKLRPPTKASPRPGGDVAYGLLIGTQQPNGQLQFSFDRDQIRNLKRILLRLRETNAAAKNIIPGNDGAFYPYTYTEKRKDAPNWVCDL